MEIRHERTMTHKIFTITAALFTVLMVVFVAWFAFAQDATNEDVLAEAQFDIPEGLLMNGVAFGEWDWVEDEWGRSIRGEVRNVSGQPLSFVTMQFVFRDSLDLSGGIVGGAEERLTTLAADEARPIRVAVWNPRVTSVELGCVITPATAIDALTSTAICAAQPEDNTTDPDAADVDSEVELDEDAADADTTG